MDHCRNYGRVPPKCHNPQQPTRGPEFVLAGGKQSKGYETLLESDHHDAGGSNGVNKQYVLDSQL